MREEFYFYVDYDNNQEGVIINWNKNTFEKNKNSSYYGYGCFQLKNKYELDEIIRYLKNNGFAEIE